MRWTGWGAWALVLVLALGAGRLGAQERIVALRHGEKPEAGLGQLNCQGLNRALALPAVLMAKFGKPAAIFAPNPAVEVDDHLKHFSYVRPLMTIEPTAIALGMPVDTQIGFNDIDGLEKAVTAVKYSGATVFIAWEHIKLNEFAKKLVNDYGGDAAAVPSWTNSDYDRIYVFILSTAAPKPSIRFAIEHEGLDGKLSTTCPGAGPPAAQPDVPAAALMQPAELAQALRSPGPKPAILQVGSEVLYNHGHVPGAAYAGPAAQPAGLERLRQRVQALPHDRELVIYCGCCPWNKCPNIRPAYRELVSLGFIHVRVLYLATSFGTDWVQQGFPVATER